MNDIEIRLKCEQCGQEYFQDSLTIAVLLYGIFFLMGKDSGYAGITCPSCLKTITYEGKRDQIEFLRETLSSTSTKVQNVGILPLSLRYHSSVNYYSKNITAYKDFDIPYYETMLPLKLSKFIREINSLDENLCKNYFCTYAFDYESPMGFFLSVGWFKKDWIDTLIQIENEKSLRIFPRYVQQNTVYDTIEELCWENHIYGNYLKDQEVRAEKAKEVTKEQNIDDSVRHPLYLMKKKYVYESNVIKNKINIIRDFRSILNDYSSPLKHAFILYNPSRTHFFNLLNPFREKQIQEIIINLDFNQLKKLQRGPSYKEMSDIIKANFHEESIQESLFKLSNEFIFEYIKLAQVINFSEISVWNLKVKYLKQLYDSIGSKYKRAHEKGHIPKKYRKNVEKIEKEYPAFKNIISEDYEIDNIKQTLFHQAQYKNRKQIFLILGETGTGKELFARAIDEASGKERPFVAFNCTSIPETMFASELFGFKKGSHSTAGGDHKGLFSQAYGGTIFLDEIGDLDLKLQLTLLRVIEEREIRPLGGTGPEAIDVIIIFATNKNLREEVEKGNFRQDLYMRINRSEEKIPPLRERKNDIPLLVKHFLEVYAKEYEKPELSSIGITDDCMKLLRKYEWPGNIRELENVIAKIINSRIGNEDTSDIAPSELPLEIRESVDSKKYRPKPGEGKRERPSKEELTKFKEEGLLQKDIAEIYTVDDSTVSKWYKEHGLR